MWSDGAPRASTVGIRVPAELDNLTMLRALTETALFVADLALDEVTDIQVAIDEIATSLIEVATPGSSIECDFGLDSGAMAVCVIAVVTMRDAIDEQGFGWHVMRTITDSLNAEIGSYDPAVDGYPATVEFGRSFGRLGR